MASEAYYNATRQYAAFSEGNSPLKTVTYEEWVVMPSGYTWNITSVWERCIFEYRINFIIYSKVAFSFLSLYNTAYARNMVIYLEQSAS